MIDQFKDKYAFLSNFYSLTIPIVFGYSRFYSVEAAYQSAKATNIDVQKLFADLTPGQAKRFGRSIELRPDWEKIKVDTMYTLVYRKFYVDPILRRDLLRTFPETIIETNTWGDTFWGICNGKGQNKLGEILMQIRADFYNQMGG